MVGNMFVDHIKHRSANRNVIILSDSNVCPLLQVKAAAKKKAVSKPQPQPAAITTTKEAKVEIKAVECYGKTISCLIRGRSVQAFALVEAVCRVYFPNSSLVEFIHFLEIDLAVTLYVLKKAEEDAQNALLKELELGELKSRFVSMASHEFRTPLTGILSSISLISKHSLPTQEEKKQKHVKRIKSAVQNLTSILNDFLSLDKLQAGKINCQAEWFNIVEFITTLMEESEQLKKSGQNIELIQQNLTNNDEFYTDRHILKNILLNLISNAIKYSEDFDPIKLIFKKEVDWIHIRVEDQGIGIPEEEQKRMFERFFRAKNASNIQGTGLGLSIVFEYMNLLQGRISFESKENIGSTFTLEIPNYST